MVTWVSLTHRLFREEVFGPVLGPARAVEPQRRDRPLIGMTSSGKTLLRYMLHLKPALEARGAIADGGGRAAGRHGVPQIVSVVCHDLVDLVGWHPLPERFRDKPFHEHNRIMSTVVLRA